ncbi:MAG: STAS domain-containing protein [Spirochaetes bacterium]|nr:STAS domain-containing protein [Spirochaetota bacterium]
MSALQYSSSKKGDKVLIKIGGSLDLDAAPKLNKKLGDDIDKGAKKIVLNLADVDYIASAGLGAIISNNTKAVKGGGEIRLSSMPEKVAKIFTLLGFINLFKIYTNDEEALKSF